MKTTTRRQPKKKIPRKPRQFAKVDVAYFSDEDENENPDWLVGAN